MTVASDVTGCFLGLDIGGTKTSGGLVRFPEGRVVLCRQIATNPSRPANEVLADLLSFAAGLVQEGSEQGIRVAGIGAGIAELVTPAGEVTSAQTFRFPGFTLRDQLSRLAPTVVESDVRAAAWAEGLHGAGRPFGIFVYLSVGTGISHTLMIHGRPYPGARGNALVLASGTVTQTCPHCGARHAFVLEQFASGPAIATRYAASLEGKPCTGEDVTRAAKAGDPQALNVIGTAGEALGVAAASLVNYLDPEAIVVGGGLGLCKGHYWERFVESTRAHIWADGSRALPIVTADLGAHAGIIGAAAAFWKSSNGSGVAAQGG